MKSRREENDIRFQKKNRLENGADQMGEEGGGSRCIYSFYLFIYSPSQNKTSGKKKKKLPSLSEMYLFYTERQFNMSPAEQSPFLKDTVITTTTTTIIIIIIIATTTIHFLLG